MKTDFKASCLPTLIGSLPVDNHEDATKLVLEYTPEIPLWVQLPVYRQEGMIEQFLPGIPGLTTTDDKFYIDTSDENFEADYLLFYEEYLKVTDGQDDFSDTRFSLKPDIAAGFFEFIRQVERLPESPVGLKGQITGPVTLGTATRDQDGKAIFYDSRLRDAVVKLVAMKARWQVKQLSVFNCPVIIFFDEPALTGFGSSEFISITREDIEVCFSEVIDAVHDEGGLTGVHVCANAEWPLVLESAADIVSFDAYSYFNRFLLYPEQIKNFYTKGGILAWGIAPTLSVQDLEKETADSLVSMWEEKAGQLADLGINPKTISEQSLITPSCGTGTLSLAQATKALELTRDVSAILRDNI